MPQQSHVPHPDQVLQNRQEELARLDYSYFSMRNQLIDMISSDPLMNDGGFESPEIEREVRSNLIRTAEESLVELRNVTERYLTLRDELINTWVLNPGARIPRIPQLELLDWLREHNHRYFRHCVRVSPATFDYIHGLIANHSIFHNNSNNAQMPVAHQLLIFLNRAGHYGNSATPEDLGDWAGVSTGTVNNCTKCVIVALLSLHDAAVHYPGEEEREASRQYVEERVGWMWRNGYLTVDGTRCALFQRPGLFGEAWFDRCSAYSINIQAS